MKVKYFDLYSFDMPLDSLELLKIYYQHLQHTEKIRTHFTQISVVIALAVMVVSKNLGLGEKILLGFLMLAFSYFGNRICNNYEVVINGYNSAINTLIGEDTNPLYFVGQITGEKYDGTMPIQETQFSFSDSYSNIFFLLTILWGIYILTLFFYLFAVYF